MFSYEFEVQYEYESIGKLVLPIPMFQFTLVMVPVNEFFELYLSVHVIGRKFQTIFVDFSNNNGFVISIPISIPFGIGFSWMAEYVLILSAENRSIQHFVLYLLSTTMQIEQFC